MEPNARIICGTCARWERWYRQTNKEEPPDPEQLIIPEFVDEQVLVTQIASLHRFRDWANREIQSLEDEVELRAGTIRRLRNEATAAKAGTDELKQRYTVVLAELEALQEEVDQMHRRYKELLLDTKPDGSVH